MADGFLGHWIGNVYLGLKENVHPYYVMIALFVILVSIGEAFYSPRVYEYAAAIAPKGQEASYGALSYIPFLLAKLLVGTFSARCWQNIARKQDPEFRDDVADRGYYGHDRACGANSAKPVYPGTRSRATGLASACPSEPFQGDFITLNSLSVMWNSL